MSHVVARLVRLCALIGVLTLLGVGPWTQGRGIAHAAYAMPATSGGSNLAVTTGSPSLTTASSAHRPHRRAGRTSIRSAVKSP